MSTTVTEITAGQTLTARSACDYDCIFSIEIVSRKGQFAVVRHHGKDKRVKIHNWDGVEGVYAFGRYSMAPFFRADSE